MENRKEKDYEMQGYLSKEMFDKIHRKQMLKEDKKRIIQAILRRKVG